VWLCIFSCIRSNQLELEFYATIETIILIVYIIIHQEHCHLHLAQPNPYVRCNLIFFFILLYQRQNFDDHSSHSWSSVVSQLWWTLSTMVSCILQIHRAISLDCWWTGHRRASLHRRGLLIIKSQFRCNARQLSNDTYELLSHTNDRHRHFNDVELSSNGFIEYATW